MALQVFCNILDLAALNAHILYTKVGGVDIPHQEFYLQLAEDLCEKAVEARLNNISVSREAAGFWPALLSNEPQKEEDNQIRRQCQVALCNKNKTAQKCLKCRRYVCGKCVGKTLVACQACLNEVVEE